MNYPNVIVFDDDKAITESFSKLLAEDGYKAVTANSIEELGKLLEDEALMAQTAALIFDLAQNDAEEATAKGFSITGKIQENFNRWRIPIFIHSGFADKYSEFKDCGTVWKKEKSGTSVENVCMIIKTLTESGFSDMFGTGGHLETTLLTDLHLTFTNQFRTGEIEEILKMYKGTTSEERERLMSVFKRIALNSFVSELKSPEVIINPSEIYYRRGNKLEFWTGDVFRSIDEKDTILILTPRCNVASKGVTSLLVCQIDDEFPKVKRDLIRRAVTDNPDFSGNAYRYLPPSYLFKGGRVNVSAHRTITKEELLEGYIRLFTLTDDITNEILAKFGSYFLRTGINPINVDEIVTYFDQMKEPEEKK